MPVEICDVEIRDADLQGGVGLPVGRVFLVKMFFCIFYILSFFCEDFFGYFFLTIQVSSVCVCVCVGPVGRDQNKKNAVKAVESKHTGSRL